MVNFNSPQFLSNRQLQSVSLFQDDSVDSSIKAGMGMVLQLADGRIVACNADAERLMGMSAAQMTGWQSTSPNWQVVREDGSSFPGEEHPAMVALRTGKPCCDVMMGFYQPNGMLVWLLLNSQPLFQDEHDQAYAVLTTLTSVPQPKSLPQVANGTSNGQALQTTFRAEAALNLLIAENQILRSRNERLQLALEGADLGLWDYDLETDQLVWSNRCKTMFCCPIDAAITYDKFLEIVHPADRSAIHSLIQQAIQAATDYDLEIRLKADSERWIRLKGNVYRNAEGQPSRMVGIGIDITNQKWIEEQLRHSEDHYRCLAECVPQLIWTANSSGDLDDTNQRWLNYTGVTLEQAQGDGWLQLVHPDDVANLAKVWTRAQQQKSIYQAECRLRSRSGEYRWFLVKAMPMTDLCGTVLKWYGTSTDIEDQKQLELERLKTLELEQSARVEAERANRMKDELLMMLSHELRTPLNPILGWCRLLQTRELSPGKIKEAIASIERNAERQRQTVEDLLDVANLLRGGIQLDWSVVNLARPVEAAIASIQAMADAKNIELKTAIATDILPILGDAKRLQKIVWNLLSNAIKFTPQGGQITVRLDQIETIVRLQVIDNGAGIQPDFLPYVFEPFRQFNSSTTRNYGGLGLGLTIVRHLVELHQGTVNAQSSGANEGTAFIVYFPTKSIDE